jgi:hypothetical protein
MSASVDRTAGSHVDATMKRSWTLVTLLALGGTAGAESVVPEPMTADVETVGRSHRGVAENYLVMPRGGELSAQMKFVTAERMLDGDALKFTDLALFEVSGRWSLFTRLELGASVSLLPKQPSDTEEKPWQSVGFTLRSPLGTNVALQLAGAGGHLMSHTGKWTSESLTLEWRKPIHDVLAFDVQGGVSGLGLDAPNTASSAFITEVSLSTTAMFRMPNGVWGAWMGIGYAVPVQSTGRDPTTDMTIDPQPRLGFHSGTVVSLVKNWDLFVDISVIDRGDRGQPATQLPILDGGFDQRQVIFGITRHVQLRGRRSNNDDYSGDSMPLARL